MKAHIQNLKNLILDLRIFYLPIIPFILYFSLTKEYEITIEDVAGNTYTASKRSFYLKNESILAEVGGAIDFNMTEVGDRLTLTEQGGTRFSGPYWMVGEWLPAVNKTVHGKVIRINSYE